MCGLGAATAVGAVLGSRFVSVRPELPIERLPPTFAEWGGTQIGVVDEEGRLVGKVWRDDFAPQRSPGRVAGDRMSRALYVLEGQPVTRAVEAAVREHSRVIFVVNTDRVLVGTLSDLDLLRWVTRERRQQALRSGA
jgi:CBS-domain-containing membrane protein